MAIKFADRVKETTTTTSTGTIDLAGTSTGYRTFVSGVGTGSSVTYCIKHQSADEWEVGIGVVTDATPDTLSRLSVLASSNAGSLVSFASGTKDVFLVEPAGLVTEEPALCNGRLTLESGVAISTTDQTAKSTIYFTPYKGNKISLFNGYAWKAYTFTELSIAVPSDVFRLYDVFVYDNAGTLTLELTAWDSGGQTTGSITGATNATPVVITSASHGRSIGDLVGINSVGGNTAPNGKIWYLSNTTTTFTLEGSVGNGVYTSGGTWYLIPTARTTAITLQDGVYVKSGATTRKYVGTFMTGSTAGQTEDSYQRKLVWNVYNRVNRRLLANTTGTHTYTTGAYRAWNASTSIGAQQVWIVRGLDEDLVKIHVDCLTNNASTQKAAIGIGINRCAAQSADHYGGWAQSINTYMSANYTGLPGIGFKFIQKIQTAIDTTGTTTWIDSETYLRGMIVEIMA